MSNTYGGGGQPWTNKNENLNAEICKIQDNFFPHNAKRSLQP